jgi:acyl-CoA dehydrogenase
VPTDLPGVEIGRRHLPALLSFQNGPTWATTSSSRSDNVIGGVAQVGKGWKMLMSALAAGRGISLPSLSRPPAPSLRTRHGAYARIREQFHVPIGRFQADPGAARPHGGTGLSDRCRAAHDLRRHRSRPQAGGRSPPS